MKISLYSTNKAVIKIFNSLFNSLMHKKDEVLEVCDPGQLVKKSSGIHPSEMIYCDLSSFADNDKKRLYKSIEQIYKYGLIDPDNEITDSASLFFNNASDYIGKSLLKEGFTIDRIREAYRFREIPEGTLEPVPLNFILTKSWNEIKPGKEYTFCLMFVELDELRELKKQTGASIITEIVKDFHDFLSKVVSFHNGKIWMWMDFGGLVLLPFDGQGCDVIISCIKMMMNRKMINAEYFGYDIELRYRIALHIGNTVYKKRGETGGIISDSINSIFHLGQKHAEPGNFYMTEYVTGFIPAGLRNLFFADGEFEGRQIYRMRLPLGF